ncbi:MAG: 7-carboxy-7-deazaguanine synthase QueE [Candidatus Krumholzibacteria bacterium]|nr:7-carboxy-7-deazaguanine synthase QueE [Candidatus Krumholzibacteria bacterium]
MVDTGYTAEVFRSIQGEGPYVGVLQVFLRTSGCGLSCRYCDTAFARKRLPECTLKGPETSRKIENPVAVDTLVSFVTSLVEASPGVHSLSITGGEPLEQPGFLACFIHRSHHLNLPVYLETNGLAEAAVRDIAPLVDIVSLDIKLPSLCGRGDLFATYERVLPLFSANELFCKVVVAEGFEPREFMEAVRLVMRFDYRTPFIIQPARQVGACRPVESDKLLECYFDASQHLESVRVIPQCNHLIGLP